MHFISYLYIYYSYLFIYTFNFLFIPLLSIYISDSGLYGIDQAQVCGLSKAVLGMDFHILGRWENLHVDTPIHCAWKRLCSAGLENQLSSKGVRAAAAAQTSRALGCWCAGRRAVRT